MSEQIPLQSNEEIVPIQGYEGLYSITSFGRVWSHKRKVKSKGGSYRECGGIFLAFGIDDNFYFNINLYRDNIKITHTIHTLVGKYFIPNPNNLPMVNHKDGNKQNNFAGTAENNYTDGNLGWCTRQENENHAIKNNLKSKRTSSFYGVYFNTHYAHKNKPWVAQVRVNKQRILIGNYKFEIEAAEGYNNYIIEHNINRPLNNLEEGNIKWGWLWKTFILKKIQ